MYTKLKDGDTVAIGKSGGVVYFACCDCGLVHRFVFKPEGVVIKMTVFRDKDKFLDLRLSEDRV